MVKMGFLYQILLEFGHFTDGVDASGRQSGLFPAKTNLLHRSSGSFVFVSPANIYSIMIDSSLQTISPEGEPIKRIGSGFSIMAPFISKALAELRLQLLSTMLKQLTKLGGVSQDQKGGRC